MDATIAAILTLDGLTTGAVYALLAISLVLVFSVTRVIFIPAGEFVAFGALTMAALQAGRAPPTALLTLALGVAVALLDAKEALRERHFAALRGSLAWNLGWPLAVWSLARMPALQQAGMAVQVLLTLAVLVPAGPMLHRLCFAPLQGASVLTLLIAAVALHFAMLGIGLVMFGAEGSRTLPLTELKLGLAGVEMSGQSLAVVATSLAAMGGLALFFGHTLTGKALRATAVNRIGAQLVGIGPRRAGALAFVMATSLSVFSGILIGPLTTVYYESGFLIGLKGFVGAIIGGLAGYPLAVGGALLVGLIESFASFWASAYKEVLVFSLIVPVLAWRSLTHHGIEEDGLTPPPARGGSAAFRRVLPWVLLAALASMPLLGAPAYWITLANYIGVWSIVTLGLVLLTGHAGLTSFGQSAFVGIGAYTTAYLASAQGAGPVVTLLASVVLTTGCALVLGLITLRLQGHYLPLCTIAWCLSLFYLFGNVEALGKFDGITNIPPLALGPWRLEHGGQIFYLIWAIVALAVLGLRNLLDSRPGRVIRALKKGALMEESCGIDTAAYKLLAFVVAAVLAGVAGWLYAYLQRAVNPTPFGLAYGIEYLFMAVVGGVGHLWGAITGAALLTLGKDWLQNLLPRLLGQSGNFEVIVFGLAMIALLQRAPEGIWGLVAKRFGGRRGVDAAPQAAELPLHAQPPAGQALLELRAARRSFGGLVAVNDVSFDVRAGEIVGLIGPNGAGKSTLFNLVSGVLPLSGGEVVFNGRPAGGVLSRELARQRLGRSFQHVRLVSDMSVLDNVMIGAHLRGRHGVVASVLRANAAEEASLRREAARQLDRVGLGHCLAMDAGALALGQQRTLEIARALCLDPVLLLLDEPAAGLRYPEKQALAALLRQLRGQGLAVLLVEHDMDFVMGLVDRLVVMDFGTRIAEGAPADVKRDPRVLEAYLGVDEGRIG